MENTISLYEKGTGYNRGGEYYVVQYPRTSDGDLFRVGYNDLDFCYMWRLRSDLRSFMEIFISEKS